MNYMFVKKIVFGVVMVHVKRKRLELVTMIVNGVEMATAKNLKVVEHALKIADNVKLLHIVAMECAMPENVILVALKIVRFLNVKMGYVNLKKERIV